MNKIIILSSMLFLLISAEARARVDVSVGLFAEPAPAYVEAPAYVGAPYGVYPYMGYPIYPTYAMEGGGYYRGHDHRGHGHGHHGHRR